MEQKIMKKVQPTNTNKPEISKSQESIKAYHLSSNPINGREPNDSKAHFEAEVESAFFRIFFGC